MSLKKIKSKIMQTINKFGQNFKNHKLRSNQLKVNIRNEQNSLYFPIFLRLRNFSFHLCSSLIQVLFSEAEIQTPNLPLLKKFLCRKTSDNFLCSVRFTPSVLQENLITLHYSVFEN